VVSFIGIAGSWVGTGSISCSSNLACAVCSQMLMTETAAVNEEVLDAVAELTNMIIGGVKTDLERYLGPLGLSIPTVVFGRNFRTRSVGSTEWIVVNFPWNGEILGVKFSLAPAEKTNPINLHNPHACALEI
jgi:chemotaxis protein CheX